MTTKLLYKITYAPVGLTMAEQATDAIRDTVLYRYAASDNQAVFIAKLNMPCRHEIGWVGKVKEVRE